MQRYLATNTQHGQWWSKNSVHAMWTGHRRWSIMTTCAQLAGTRAHAPQRPFYRRGLRGWRNQRQLTRRSTLVFQQDGNKLLLWNSNTKLLNPQANAIFLKWIKVKHKALLAPQTIAKAVIFCLVGADLLAPKWSLVSYRESWHYDDTSSPKPQ